MYQALRSSKMKVSPTIATRIFNNTRHVSTAATTTITKAATSPPKTAKKEFIYQRIYDAHSKGGKVSDVLYNIMRTGQSVSRITLLDCFRDLRRNGLYPQCLEILDWFEKGRFDPSGRDSALRMTILHKLKGLDEVEKYFDTIPSEVKNQYVYGSLLNCYCADLATDKALATFQKMDELGFASHVLAFNNLIQLYVKTKQPEKVLELVSQMKERNIPLNSHTYSFRIQSCRLLGDLEGVERIFHEAQEDECVKDDWVIHCNVASVFIEAGEFEKACSYLVKLETVVDKSDNPSRTVFLNMMSLYAGAGKLESVIQTWNKLKSKCEVNNKQSYLSLLQALSRLGDIKGLEKYFEEWKSICKSYDDRVPAVLIDAYLKQNMVEEADLVLKDAAKETGDKLRTPHIKFMNYYFEKGQTDSALKHMEAAVVSKWKPLASRLDPCFQHFKSQKDVDGLEKFCELLKKAQALDVKAYIWLLQTYVDAEKTAPDMRERIEKDGINLTPELEELLDRVCSIRF